LCLFLIGDELPDAVTSDCGRDRASVDMCSAAADVNSLATII